MWTWRCGTSWPEFEAGIGKQPIAASTSPASRATLPDGADKTGDLGVRARAPKNRPTRHRRPFGMTRMWIGASGLMSWKASACSSSYTFFARDLPAQDPRENVAVVIGLGRVDRHGVSVARPIAASSQLCGAAGFGNLRPVASLAPQPFPWRSLLEPMRGAPLAGGAVVVWLAGACYCHSYSNSGQGLGRPVVGQPDLVCDRGRAVVRLVRMVEAAAAADADARPRAFCSDWYWASPRCRSRSSIWSISAPAA